MPLSVSQDSALVGRRLCRAFRSKGIDECNTPLSSAYKSSRSTRNLKIGEPFLRLRGECPPSRCAAPTDTSDDCKNKKSPHRSGVSGHKLSKVLPEYDTLVTEFLKEPHVISCCPWQDVLAAYVDLSRSFLQGLRNYR